MILTASILISVAFASDPNPVVTPRTDYEMARQVVQGAYLYLKQRPPGSQTCSGFVAAVYSRLGVPLSGGSTDLWNRAMDIGAVHYHTRPRIGDIAFYDNTFDANHNRRFDDPTTHVAIVLEVHEDGTILLAHGGATNGRSTFHMNLEHPEQASGPDNERWNNNVRAQRAGDPDETEYLASMLFAGFATVWRSQAEEWTRPYVVESESDSGLEP